MKEKIFGAEDIKEMIKAEKELGSKMHELNDCMKDVIKDISNVNKQLHFLQYKLSKGLEITQLPSES